MRTVGFLLIHLAILFLKMVQPGGVRAVITENLALRHQLAVLNRNHRRAPNLRSSDRILFGLLPFVVNPGRPNSIAVVVNPVTILRFHRALVKRKYRRLFSARRLQNPGPKGPSRELINAIIEIKQRNPNFGCPRIAETLTLTFGIPIDKDVVRRVLAKHNRPTPGDPAGPSWLTFIGHTRDSLWSVDLFRCESFTLQSYWVLLVMDQWSRRIVGFGIHQGSVNGVALCRMFNKAVSGNDPP